ncbi:dihydrolipoamide acetyltransferase family protein [Kitasatospora azatica]|uniref:dihydrolipoamide acetyltransferase family protein n=1 Tax=Kitasatospora azatica TaxID=58347 RepID=UPI000560A43D|nr:dihydrolipoamide acetyltransferase family protein [Kitasatospora azatica]
MTVHHFLLPDVGEGLTEAEIIRWQVSPGDSVRIDDPIVEIETSKSLVELPSPYQGTVVELLALPGTLVPVGSPIIAIASELGAEAMSEAMSEAMPEAMPEVMSEVMSERTGGTGGELPERESLLVGHGPWQAGPTRRRRGRPSAPAVPVRAARAAGVATAAKPPVRKLAKELGIDLATLLGTGPDGTVTRADVLSAASPATAPATSPAAPPAPAEAPAGPVTRVPITGVRRATAAAMVRSAFTAPQANVHTSVDVTDAMALLHSLRERSPESDLRATPLLLAAKALIAAVERHPWINASWDEAGDAVLVAETVNLGIAAATPRGLLVPNIKGAEQLSLSRLSAAIGRLVADARAGRTTPAELRGGTVTLTNIGVFGVEGGIPILNPGESAILAVGAVLPRPWVHEGEVRARSVVELSLSFDHRVVDGDTAARALADTAAFMADPLAALL